MNHSYKTCKNRESLYFGSGIMNNETLGKAQQYRRKNSLRSIQGMEDMAFPTVRDDFQIFFLGSIPRNAFGADSPLVSPVTLGA